MLLLRSETTLRRALIRSLWRTLVAALLEMSRRRPSKALLLTKSLITVRHEGWELIDEKCVACRVVKDVVYNLVRRASTELVNLPVDFYPSG
jgi:hypothetical protein